MTGAAQAIIPLRKLDAVAVFDALGSAVRWPIILRLADGRKLTISEAAAWVGCTAVNMSKHLNVLRRAGVVVGEVGEDRRQSVFSIPAARRPLPGVLDYGCCRIDLTQL